MTARRRGPAWLGVVNETLRFLCEVAVVVVLGWWGWATPPETWLRVVLVLALPLAACVVWALLGVPRRSMFVGNRWLPSFVIWFLGALASLALWDLGHPAAAAVLAALVVVTDVGVQAGVHTPFRPGPGDRPNGSLRP